MVLSEQALAGVAQAARLIQGAGGRASAFTGAGISVESGIPDFRSAGGLWSRYNPGVYCDYETFKHSPHLFWRMARELVMDVHVQLGGDRVEAMRTGAFVWAEPNPAHKALAELQSTGKVAGIITQNIDGLHTAAGSASVIELHGTDRTCTCMTCRSSGIPQSEVLQQWMTARAKDPSQSIESDMFVPRHAACGGGVLKANVTFFGEGLPAGALMKATSTVMSSSVCMVVGSSLTVAPANTIPPMVKARFGKLIVCNLDESGRELADVFIQGKASDILSAIVQEVKTLEANGVPSGRDTCSLL